MSDQALQDAVGRCDIFTKLSPGQRWQVVNALRTKGHTVGYMGDGVDDALALREADIGITMGGGMDIAKETADIILPTKDLAALRYGVMEGRRSFGNMMKYIKLTASSRFGNLLSVMFSAVLLPFAPMLPVQMLAQQLLCDFSHMGISGDRADEQQIRSPRNWGIEGIQRFGLTMGLLSSLFDLVCFGAMWWLVKANATGLAPLFQVGWFLFGTLAQILIVYVIRTREPPFGRNRASAALVASTAAALAVTLAMVFTGAGRGLGLAVLPLGAVPWLVVLLASYCVAAHWLKGVYVRRCGEWV